jgi:small neutral amino acid transporter SnatA (MarC family)
VWHTALVAFATFFVTIAPLKVVPVFAVLTKEGDPAYRRRMAMKGTVIAGLILLIFGIWGDDLLRLLGISLPALRIGGGILLMLLAIDLVFERAPRVGPSHGRAAGRRAPARHRGVPSGHAVARRSCQHHRCCGTDQRGARCRPHPNRDSAQVQGIVAV